MFSRRLIALDCLIGFTSGNNHTISSMPHHDLAASHCLKCFQVTTCRPGPYWTWLLAAAFGLVCMSGDVVVAATRASEIEPQPATLTGTVPDWDNIRAMVATLMNEPPGAVDPLVYFIEPLGRQLGLPDAASTLAAKKLPPALAAELSVKELAEAARRLVRGLVAWNVGRGIQDLTRVTEEAEIDRLSRQLMEQAAWLARDEEVPHTRSIMASLPALKLNGTQAPPTTDEAAYRDYAAFLDAKYTTMPDNSDSWLAILERSGMQAWHERLSTAPDNGAVNGQETQGLAERYTASRLHPLLRLSLARHGSQLEAWAAQRTYADWLNLSGWKDSVRLRRGLARLCGSWQWTIHNHQNHGEQKLNVSFPPPDSAAGQTGPAETVVLGDLVYLRWEAGGRIQEDSLLFSKEGQRLEGTFVNNMGGWGSITGKRIAGCSKNSAQYNR